MDLCLLSMDLKKNHLPLKIKIFIKHIFKSFSVNKYLKDVHDVTLMSKSASA